MCLSPKTSALATFSLFLYAHHQRLVWQGTQTLQRQRNEGQWSDIYQTVSDQILIRHWAVAAAAVCVVMLVRWQWHRQRVLNTGGIINEQLCSDLRHDDVEAKNHPSQSDTLVYNCRFWPHLRRRRCEWFWCKILAAEYFANSCRLFVTSPVWKGL